MTGHFAPRYDILSERQRQLLPRLAPAAQLRFVLYGGTAIALRQGHRASVDFHFFSGNALDRGALHAAMPFTRTAHVLQESPDTLTLLAAGSTDGGAGAKVSFFCMPGFGRVGQPDRTDDGMLIVASPQDLLATKLKTILQRAKSKDYRDIAALLRAGGSLDAGLAGARALFGATFQPAEAAKALTYFGDGDLDTLATADRTLLVEQAAKVGELPVARLGGNAPA